MSREKKILTIGVWIAILPYLGFPYVFKNILFTLTGFLIIYYSYTLYQEKKRKEKKTERTFDNFSENRDFIKPE